MREEPKLSTDHTGVLFIVIDDDGEPVTDYHSDLDVAITERDTIQPSFRICEVAYRIIDEKPVVLPQGREEEGWAVWFDDAVPVIIAGVKAGVIRERDPQTAEERNCESVYDFILTEKGANTPQIRDKFFDGLGSYRPGLAGVRSLDEIKATIEKYVGQR